MVKSRQTEEIFASGAQAILLADISCENEHAERECLPSLLGNSPVRNIPLNKINQLLSVSEFSLKQNRKYIQWLLLANSTR